MALTKELITFLFFVCETQFFNNWRMEFEDLLQVLNVFLGIYKGEGDVIALKEILKLFFLRNLGKDVP